MKVGLFAHSGRPDAVDAARELGALLETRGMETEQFADLDAFGSMDLMVVFGGDGTILKAAHEVRDQAVPILGVNLGNVGFLAEAERGDVARVADAISGGQYLIHERMAIEIAGAPHPDWALNEFAISKSESAMVDLLVEVDGRPVSRWGCDGVIVATPTGSTAYAFSAGGPIIWPQVEAIAIVPVAAHALFDRPLVIDPTSSVEITLLAGSGMITADGTRHQVLPIQQRVTITPAAGRVRLARLTASPFTDRLVAKFKLPIDGWRGSA